MSVFYGTKQAPTENEVTMRAEARLNQILEEIQQNPASIQQHLHDETLRARLNDPGVQQKLQAVYQRPENQAYLQNALQQIQQAPAHVTNQTVFGLNDNNIQAAGGPDDLLSLRRKGENKPRRQRSWRARLLHYLRPDTYKPYFDVTTRIVIKRLFYAFRPFSDDFFELDSGRKPDLYGAIWVYTTLVFLISSSANISIYLQSPGTIYFLYNYDYIATAALLSFGYGFLCPSIIMLVSRWFCKTPLLYMQACCLYGYISACYLPVAALLAIPIQATQWVLIVIAILNSSSCLYNNINKLLQQNRSENQLTILVIITLIQVTILLIFKLYFFPPLYNLTIITQGPTGGGIPDGQVIPNTGGTTLERAQFYAQNVELVFDG